MLPSHPEDLLIIDNSVTCDAIEPNTLNAEVAKYEALLFKLGAMRNAPCFKCGYNGEGYYQADKHPCAEQHHKLCENDLC